jgi:hypothetical protein
MTMKLSNFLIITLSIFAIMVSGCLAPQHYDENGISFNYPANWKTGVITDLPGAVVGISESGNVDVKIFKKQMPADSNLETVYNDSLTNQTIELDEYGYQQISSKTITVDGVRTYENIYQTGKNSTQTRQKIRQVWLEKNGYIYTIICTVIPPEDFPEKNMAFDEIINSFHVS